MSAAIKLDAGLHSIDDLHAIPGVAEAAEKAGFDGLWASEVNHDPFIQLALAATRTTRLELGTAIALSFTRSPMTLAYTAWDLAAMTQGHFILGLGTQVKAHNERRFSVPWSAPIPRLREVIEGLRAIWRSWRTGERLNYRGEHYKFTLMTPFFTPPRHRHDIPIYIAGVNTGLCRLAGELCDGFHVHPLHSVKYLSEVIRPAISEGAQAAGRTINDVALSASVFVVTGTEAGQRDFVEEMVRQQIAFYASTPSYRPVFEIHGWGDVAAELSRLAARKRWGEMGRLISPDILETFAIVAGPDEVGPAALERYTGLLDRITFYLPYLPGQFDELWHSAIRTFSEQQ
ncbi:MAG TPA: TIGR03617 family F420-dependent LLM class oxidoreductase [Chloroflexi bacterium]|nr:TIGR03617 family F420-dependent LLM class oxidoreductase [Chloroflexota bacterium]